MSIQTYNVYEGLTSVRLVSSINIDGTYNNGNLNNGVGAFIVIPSNIFSVDLKEVSIGDALLLVGQTNSNENGIYVCIQTGGIYSFSVIQRRQDFHCIEQIRGGQYITSSDGTSNIGLMYLVKEPLPNIFGVDDINFINSSPGGFREYTISDSDLAELKNYTGIANLAVLNGINLNFSSPLDTTFSLDPQIVLSANISSLSGIVKGFYINTGSITKLSGSYIGTSSVVGNGVDINMEDATINGAFIVGNVTNMMGIGTPTDVSAVTPHLTLNTTGVTLNAFHIVIGDFNYLFDLNDAVSYFSVAGTGSGQAGDVTKCNAQSVLRLKVNGSDKYLPLFDTN